MPRVAGGSGLRLTRVNYTDPLRAGRSPLADALALDRLFEAYSPLGTIRRVGAPLSQSGLPGCTADAGFVDLDRLLKSAVGSSANSAINQTLHAGGKGLDLPSCVASTLGEALERVFGVFLGFAIDEQVVVASMDHLASLGRAHLGKSELTFFTKEQLAEPTFQYDDLTPDTAIRWVPGRRLMSGDECLVPAQMVPLLNIIPPNEPRFMPANSVGMAAGRDRDFATFRAVTELVERDATGVSWFMGGSCAEIDADSVLEDPAIGAVLGRHRTWIGNYQYRLFPSRVEGIHVVTVSRHVRQLSRYAWRVGAAASTDIRDAILRALAECLEGEHTMSTALRYPKGTLAASLAKWEDPGVDAAPEDIPTPLGSILYYGYPAQADALVERLRPSSTVRLADLDSVPPHLDTLKSILRTAELDPIVVDMAWDGSPLGEGAVAVVKAVCPDLAWPNTPPAPPMLGHWRYEGLSEDGSGDTEHGFTRMPLPYA